MISLVLRQARLSLRAPFIGHRPASLCRIVGPAAGPVPALTRRPFHWTVPVLTASHGSHKIELRDYQIECIQAVTDAFAAGKKRIGVSLATGGGKTVIFTQLISRVPDLTPQATKTLILAHRRELVQQAAAHCRTAYPDKTVEIDMGKDHASGTADITIASVRSLTSKSRLDNYNPAEFKLVLVDEAHHIVASGYQVVLDHFGLKNKPEDGADTTKIPGLVGVSATFSRFDGLRLGASIDEIVYHRDYVAMISDKWLSDVFFTCVSSEVDLRAVRSSSNGDYNSADLSEAVNNIETNEITVRTWLSLATDRKSTLVFAVDRQHVADLAAEFQRRGIDARYVTSNTNDVDRREMLDEFRAGKFPVLVNCGVFTEGTDIPNIDCVLLARPTRSTNLLIQMIGRGMRLHPSKKDCHIIDMVATVDAGLVTTPTLFGLDPAELVTRATLKEMKEKGAEAEQGPDGVADSLFATVEESSQNEDEDNSGLVETEVSDADVAINLVKYDSVFDLLSSPHSEATIRSISRLAWVNVDHKTFVLSGPDGSYVRIEPDSHSVGDFNVMHVRKLPKQLVDALKAEQDTGKMGRNASLRPVSPYAAPRCLASVKGLEHAVHAADTWAQNHLPLRFVVAAEEWRGSPATLHQLNFLNKMQNANQLTEEDYQRALSRRRYKIKKSKLEDIKLPPTGETLTPEHLTRGMAGDMITKLKHGAKGRYQKLLAAKKKAEKLELQKQKIKERRKHEKVKVGPVNW